MLFITGVCQIEHLHESLYVCVSCTVYIVVRLMLFITGVCQIEHLHESLYVCVSCAL
jgi:hypothetical protein